FTADGLRLVSAGADGAARVWDAGTGNLVAEHAVDLIADFHWPRADAAFDRDGRQLAGVSRKDPRVVKVWDMHMGQEVLALRGHSHPVTCVAFAPNGERLASAEADGWKPGGPSTIRLWDARTGRELRHRAGHEHAITGLAFSPDGRCLASSSFD